MMTEQELLEAMLRVEAENDRTNHVHRPPQPIGVPRVFDSVVDSVAASVVDSVAASVVDSVAASMFNSSVPSTSTCNLQFIIEVKHG